MMMMNFLEKYSDSVFLYSIFINDEQKCLIQSNKRMMMRYIVCVNQIKLVRCLEKKYS